MLICGKMPKMMLASVHHSLVAVRNRLFVIARTTTKVFDSLSNKFSELKYPSSPFWVILIYKKFISWKKILTFKLGRMNLIILDLVENSWSVESFNYTKECKDFLCLKLLRLSKKTYYWQNRYTIKYIRVQNQQVFFF